MQAADPALCVDDVSIAVRFVLPVSGATVALRQTTGNEDLLLAERRPDDPSLALALLQRLGRIETRDGSNADWATLPVVDVDTLIVRLRQALVGDRVVAEITCEAAGCGNRVDLSFGIDAYLSHNLAERRPARGREWAAESCVDSPEWHVIRVRGADRARFRLPTLADQIAVYHVPDAESALEARCIRAAGDTDLSAGAVPARERARIEAAMIAIAPPLAGPLQGACPECGTALAVRFEARLYCMQELRDRARFVYDDIDVLAQRYHWSEHAILALPRARRAQYADRARQVAVA